MAIWIELARPYSTLKVLVWMLTSCTESGFGVRFSTPGRMALVTSSPSTMYMFPTLPAPLALASTCVSVEKLSTPDPGLPPVTVPIPITPGAMRDQRNHIAARQRKVGQRRRFERHLVPALGRIQDRDLAGDLHRLRRRGHLHRHRDIQVLAGFQRERDRGGVEAAGIHGDLVGTRGEADEPVIALRVRRCRGGHAGLRVFQLDFRVGHHGARGILHRPLDAAAKLRPTRGSQNDCKGGKASDELRTWQHTRPPRRGRRTSAAAANCELTFSPRTAAQGLPRTQN